MAGSGFHRQALRKVRSGAFAIRLMLAGIFLYSGAIKASSSAQFAMALVPFTFVPETWLGPLSILLPLCELAAGALILAPRTARFGAGLILGLCIVFATVLGWALANGIIVSCSCFGRDDQPSAVKMAIALARDIVLAGLAVAVLIVERKLSGASNPRRMQRLFHG